MVTLYQARLVCARLNPSLVEILMHDEVYFDEPQYGMDPSYDPVPDDLIGDFYPDYLDEDND